MTYIPGGGPVVEIYPAFVLGDTPNWTIFKTFALEETNADYEVLAKKIMDAFVFEFKTIIEATQKVKWAK